MPETMPEQQQKEEEQVIETSQTGPTSQGSNQNHPGKGEDK